MESPKNKIQKTNENTNGISIAFFAHKGGVGKSTLLLSFAKDIIENDAKKSVVIIDADPQLNTTFQLLKRNNLTPNDDVINNFVLQNNESNSVTLNNNHYKTLWTFLSNSNDITKDDFLFVSNTNNRMMCLLGSPLLYNLELQLINAINLSSNFPSLQNVPLLFYNLLNNIKTLFNNNVVILVDMSPSAGLFNQNLLLSCDYAILPCNPDNNSMIGIDLFFSYIASWRTQHNYLPPNHNVKLLMIILNRIKFYGTSPTLFTIHFNQLLQGKITIFEKDPKNAIFISSKNPIKLLLIRDMSRFAPICSNENITIHELTTQICKNNNTFFDQETKDVYIHEIHSIFNELRSNNVI